MIPSFPTPIFPMWKDETDEQYLDRLKRYEIATVHSTYIILVHNKTFTAGLRGVEVIMPKQRNGFSCGCAVEPKNVRVEIRRALQELIEIGGVMATIKNTWMEVDGKNVILGEADEEEVFSKLLPKGHDDKPVAPPPPPPVKPKVQVQSQITKADLIAKRNLEELEAKHQRMLQEKAEFDAKLKIEQEKDRKGLEKWFG